MYQTWELLALGFFLTVLFISIIFLIYIIYIIRKDKIKVSKNPMNPQLINKVIYCETSDDCKKVLEYYNNLGYDTLGLTGIIPKIYYGLENNNYFFAIQNTYMLENDPDYRKCEIITFEELNKLLNK